ncbi:hypothetical protein PGTUg99_035467 [Puccinia graminis f. sp. tritici]|uniref:Tet-like 2OG-Fe(II) oxygenase domain-containing protein n=1 Tax=Puccinia graminis f. sp. tritici TaxID=56615 RepID=A0A5B0RQ53_PUCGR|nr:hypothetical protein PGTUg99_035467 [Puccinia graminis f. sp. tritici]
MVITPLAGSSSIHLNNTKETLIGYSQPRYNRCIPGIGFHFCQIVDLSFILSVIVEYFSRLEVMTANRKAYLAERKRKNRSKRHADQRTSELSLTVDDTDRSDKPNLVPKSPPQTHHGMANALNDRQNGCQNESIDKIIWSSKRFIPLELYPHMLGDNPGRPPTPDEIEYAKKAAKRFKYFSHGKVVIHDKDDDSKVIALIEFTRWDQLTGAGLEDLGQVTRFLYAAKQFVNAVDSETRSWGGKMFAIGWRKAMVAFQLLGLYRNKEAIAKSPSTYDALMRKSCKISNILGRLFRRLANVAFANNQELMNDYSIPSIGHLAFNMPIKDDDCSPNLTFTTDRFFNAPHRDEEDLSDFAFGLFVPVNKNDWSPSNSNGPPELDGGQFVFPDYRCGIDFSQHDGFVKVVWRAKEVRHCTLHSINNPAQDQLGMSLQINKKIATASRDTQNGTIFERKAFKDKPRDACYIGDHQTYVNGIH